MTAVSSLAKWKERYAKEVLKSCDEYTKKNESMPVKTRKLTDEEIYLIFNVDINNIKEVIV